MAPSNITSHASLRFHLGLDVYEEESELFFENLSDQIIDDDVFTRLLSFPNVVITGHQGFFTKEAQVANLSMCMNRWSTKSSNKLSSLVTLLQNLIGSNCQDDRGQY